MKIQIFDTKQQSGQAAAQQGASLIREAIAARGHASIIVATGASQFEMLEALVAVPGVDWQKVTAFHLDEYVGLPISHPASFRLYLWQRFVSRLPMPIGAFHYLDAETDAGETIRRMSREIVKHAIDVAFIGIGENAHIAFNDPPADFDTNDPYILVTLDEACRRQQVGEGWFPTMKDVPTHAISMSVRHVLKSAAIVCTVPDERKAIAVRDSLQGSVTPDVPASILQRHGNTTIYLDRPAAGLLNQS